MTLIKTIFLNIVFFFALMFLLMLLPATQHKIRSYLQPENSDSFAKTANMPAFRDYDWAQQSLWETYLSRLKYRDFIVQRADDVAGETINVENGIRRTVGTPRAGAGAPVWFFGGSTTWGYGVSDEFTYASMFAQQTGREVINYGEGAYTSRQSLAYLQGVYLENPEGNRTVVFYDGINDLMHYCNPDTDTVNQTAHEPRFRAVLDQLDNPYTYQRLFGQLVEFAESVALRFGIKEPIIYDFRCSEEPERAQVAADRLVTIWTHAQRLVESNGDTFIGVFQPASFTSNNVHPVLPDHPYNDEILDEYLVTYPLMQEALAKSGVNYVDLSHIFDDCHDCYYDHVHVGPAAHQILVDELIKIVP